MPDIFRIDIIDTDGRYVSCEDDAEHLGPWIIRTLARLKSKRGDYAYDPNLRFTKIEGH